MKTSKRTGLLWRERKETPHAAHKVTTTDLYWAAGFLDGEGSFSFKRTVNGGGQTVMASQRAKELPLRLQKMFGGGIHKHTSRLGKKVYGNAYLWYVSGARARGVMLTLYALLSKKRQKAIRKSLA